MTLDELKTVATYRTSLYVTRDGAHIAIADIYLEFNPVTPNRWYVWEYLADEVKEICTRH